jgi:LmeA-like phospholipid-binding
VRRLAIAAAVLLGLLVVVQLVLPRLAEHYVRSEVRRNGGDVASVHVSAFPAIKLLWRHADTVRLHLRSARLGVGDLAEELQRAAGVVRLDATIAQMDLGPLRLRDIELRKRGDRLDGAATVTREDLSAALPVAVGLTPVEADDGALVLRASVGPLSARARLSASDGALRIAPDGLLGGFASLTVFRDPRVAVTGVGARPATDGFTLTAEGRLA